MAKPKLALIPSTVGGSVYSVLPSNGDGDFNFTRASAATRINAQGLIETVAVGDNRLNYPLLDGTVQTCPHLLLERQRTNKQSYSETLNVLGFNLNTLITTVNDFGISPDGTLNSAKIIADSTNGYHALRTSKATFSGYDVVSAFVKASGYNYVQLTSWQLTTDYINFDLTNGTIGTKGGSAPTIYGIEDYGNGWYRIYANIQASGGGVVGLHIVESANSGWGGATSFSGNDSNGLLVWGFQIEEGHMTSYIPTTTSAVTRLAEVCDGSGNASTFNSSEGVLMAQIKPDVDFTTYSLISINDGTTANNVVLGKSTSTGNYYTTLKSGNANQFSYDFSVDDVFNKIAVKYKANDFAVWLNGVEVHTDNSGSAPIGLDEISFDFGQGTLPFYGKTKQLQYFDSALTDSELETLTSWMSFSDMAIDLNYTIQ